MITDGKFSYTSEPQINFPVNLHLRLANKEENRNKTRDFLTLFADAGERVHISIKDSLKAEFDGKINKEAVSYLKYINVPAETNTMLTG